MNAHDLTPAELSQALSAIDPRAAGISDRMAALDAWLTQAEAERTAQDLTAAEAKLELLCECGECGTRGWIAQVEHDCSSHFPSEDGCNGMDEVECLTCDGRGVNAWTLDEVREARGLALELDTPEAMDMLHTSVMRSVAAGLVAPSQASEVMAIAIGWAS